MIIRRPDVGPIASATELDEERDSGGGAAAGGAPRADIDDRRTAGGQEAGFSKYKVFAGKAWETGFFKKRVFHKPFSAALAFISNANQRLHRKDN